MTNLLSGLNLGCNCGCFCNAIHDLCVSARLIIPFPVPSAGYDSRILVFTNIMFGNITLRAFDFGPSFPTQHGWSGDNGAHQVNSSLLPASGDLMQISIKRTGASCVSCAGDLYANDFSSAIGPSYVPGPPDGKGWGTPRGSWSIANGFLESTSTDNAYQEFDFNCVSLTATYDINFCVNGSSIGTITGYSCSLSQGTGVVGMRLLVNANQSFRPGFGYDDFKIDWDQ